MSQSESELRAELDRIKELAGKRTWALTRPTQDELRLFTIDPPDSISPDVLITLVQYSKSALGVELQLHGGGHGCVDLAFSAEPGGADVLGKAIQFDPRFQAILNDLNIHFARLNTRHSSRSFSAFHKLKIVVVTDRKKQSATIDSYGSLVGPFGSERVDDLNFGLAETLIADLLPGQPKESMLNRIWKRVTVEFNEIRAGIGNLLVGGIDFLERNEFQAILDSLSGRGIIVNVHGYANSFDDALRATALVTYRAKIDRLGYLPILYSWPSIGSTLEYLPDINLAELSERALKDALELVTASKARRDVTILAHSHGGKVLLRSLVSYIMMERSSFPFKRCILVEPDLDGQFFLQRVGSLASACERVIIYHSNNDRALALSELLFKSKRVGRGGLPLQGMQPDLSGRYEVIDVSKVARGLAKHSPHVDCSEVISDIHDLLRGMHPSERFHLRQIDADTGRWQIEPTIR
jgi:esterase/lipase superfamily enzyme